MNSHEDKKIVVFDDHENIALLMMTASLSLDSATPTMCRLLMVNRFFQFKFDEMDERIWDEDFPQLPDHPYIKLFPPDFSTHHLLL